MALFNFEYKGRPLASMGEFLGRIVANLLFAILIIGVALAIGIAGYHYIAGLGWLDAFVNASMILAGMGPVDHIDSDAGKLFAGSYALASGILILLIAGLVLAPVIHRVLHALHVDDDPR